MFDLLKRIAANVTGAGLDADHVRFFAGEDGRPKLLNNAGTLFDFVGPEGPRGFDGWEPVLAVVSDGERRVLRLVDWAGGGGTKPTAFVGQYLGPTGFTADIAAANDIRGATGLGTQGNDGWEPVLANVADGERRVLQLVDWIGGGGTKPAVPTNNYIGPTGFTNLAGATDIRGAIGQTGPAAIGFRTVTGNTGSASAETADDTLAITGGTGISTAATDTPDGLVVTNTDRGSTAVATHEQAVDPHPQYTTASEATAAANSAVATHEAAGNPHPQYIDATELSAALTAAAADAPPGAIAGASSTGTGTMFAREDHTHAGVTSVNGQQGAVTVTAGTNNAAVTRTAATASASTALTTIQSYPVAAGEITAGSEYDFKASLRVINTTAASNAVVTLSVGATNVLVLTQAVGTTAAAAPGKPVKIEGTISFASATQAECNIRIFTSTAVAFDTLVNTSAPITVSAAGATTIDLKFNTSAATSTFIARQATIKRVK